MHCIAFCVRVWGWECAGVWVQFPFRKGRQGAGFFCNCEPEGTEGLPSDLLGAAENCREYTLKKRLHSSAVWVSAAAAFCWRGEDNSGREKSDWNLRVSLPTISFLRSSCPLVQFFNHQTCRSNVPFYISKFFYNIKEALTRTNLKDLFKKIEFFHQVQLCMLF